MRDPPAALRSPAVLIGRTTETERIERLLADAREGRGGAVLIRGEAGIGKTSLLEHARGLADGALVLSARGIETEAEAAALALAREVGAHPPDGLRRLKAMFRELGDSERRIAYENALLLEFQREGAGLPRRT